MSRIGEVVIPEIIDAVFVRCVLEFELSFVGVEGAAVYSAIGDGGKPENPIVLNCIQMNIMVMPGFCWWCFP